MKQQIIAYITALTDMHRHTVNMPVKECLDNLLEFVIDIPEHKEQSIIEFNMALENEDLKQSNAELANRITKLNQLEESHAYLKDINEKLYKKVENLEIALTISKSVMDPIFKEKLRKTFKEIK